MVNTYLSADLSPKQNWDLIYKNGNFNNPMTEELTKCCVLEHRMGIQRIVCAVAFVSLGVWAAVFIHWGLGLGVACFALFSTKIVEKINGKTFADLSVKMDEAMKVRIKIAEDTLRKVPIDKDNFKAVFSLSKTYGVRERVSVCARAYEKLFEENIEELRQVLINPHVSEELKWQCLIHASMYHKDQELLEVLKDQYIPEEAKEIIRLGMRCPDLGITPTFSPSGNLYSGIDLYAKSDEGIKLLGEINKKIPIQSLSGSLSLRFTQNDLDRLAIALPDLAYISGKGSGFLDIPWNIITADLDMT